MTVRELQELVNDEDRRLSESGEIEATSEFTRLFDRLKWFGLHHWNRYLPAQRPDVSHGYEVRLAKWIGNLSSTSDRLAFLEYASYVTFFSHDDYCSLYTNCFQQHVIQWVIEKEKIKLSDDDFSDQVSTEVYNRTWYCPITDSMDISEFYHVNCLSGVEHRPCFDTLHMLHERNKHKSKDSQNQAGELTVDNLNKYIQNPNPRTNAPAFKRLVLLEDFIGSGTQSFKCINWALKNIPKLDILVIPLIICPKGLVELQKLCCDRLEVRPVITVKEQDLLGPNRNNVKSNFPCFQDVEELAVSTFKQVVGGTLPNQKVAPYSPFGFKETGVSFVGYSNTPNNTLPIIHYQNDKDEWTPLFPRASRI